MIQTSVIIPAHNAQRYLAESLDSVFAQNIPDLEVLLINDRSTDSTLTVASRYPRVRILHNEGRPGPAATRNVGLRAAQGRYIAFLDADDRWPAHKLTLQLAALQRQCGQGLVLGRSRVIAEPGATLRELPFENDRQELVLLLFGAALVARDVFSTIGYLDEDLAYGEDSDFFLRFLESPLPITVLRDATLEYRLHPGNMTHGLNLGKATLPNVLLRQARRLRANSTLKPRTLTQVDELATPDISVIIPAYQAERFLARALDSVLAQTLPPREIIVVNDGSTDGTSHVARQYGDRVHLIETANSGVGAARNTGIQYATGRQVAFLDADDVWRPHKLALQWDLLRQPPFPNFVFGEIEQYRDATGQFLSRQKGIHFTCLLARRSVFDRAGLFRTDCATGELLDWMMRAADLGLTHASVPEVIAERRQRHDSVMGSDPTRTREYLRVLKERLDSRRS